MLSLERVQKPDFVYGAETTGTTIMAVEFKDGVVIGADTRTTVGSMVSNRISDKLTEITPHIFCCRSGSSGDTQAITDVVKYHISVYEQENGCKAPVKVAANVFRDMCYRYRDSLSAGIIIGGWDPYEGGQVYSIPISGMITRVPIASGGSGCVYIFGYLDSRWKPNMNLQECTDFVTDGKALSLFPAVAWAIARDNSSGGCCRLGIITKDGLTRKTILPSDLKVPGY